MNKHIRITNLEDAQTHIIDAIELISQAVEGTKYEKGAKGYIIAHLDNWANGVNPHDDHIPNLIKKIEGE